MTGRFLKIFARSWWRCLRTQDYLFVSRKIGRNGKKKDRGSKLSFSGIYYLDGGSSFRLERE